MECKNNNYYQHLKTTLYHIITFFRFKKNINFAGSQFYITGITLKQDIETERIEASGEIEVTGARVHNLKNIDVTIPRNALTVIT